MAVVREDRLNGSPRYCPYLRAQPHRKEDATRPLRQHLHRATPRGRGDERQKVGIQREPAATPARSADPAKEMPLVPLYWTTAASVSPMLRVRCAKGPRDRQVPWLQHSPALRRSNRRRRSIRMARIVLLQATAPAGQGSSSALALRARPAALRVALLLITRFPAARTSASGVRLAPVDLFRRVARDLQQPALRMGASRLLRRLPAVGRGAPSAEMQMALHTKTAPRLLHLA